MLRNFYLFVRDCQRPCCARAEFVITSLRKKSRAHAAGARGGAGRGTRGARGVVRLNDLGLAQPKPRRADVMPQLYMRPPVYRTRLLSYISELAAHNGKYYRRSTWLLTSLEVSELIP